MWHELEEIQKPVLAVSKWIETQSQESLLKMTQPESIAEIGEASVSNEDLEAEPQSLTLEQFLGRL